MRHRHLFYFWQIISRMGVSVGRLRINLALLLSTTRYSIEIRVIHYFNPNAIGLRQVLLSQHHLLNLIPDLKLRSHERKFLTIALLSRLKK